MGDISNRICHLSTYQYIAQLHLGVMLSPHIFHSPVLWLLTMRGEKEWWRSSIIRLCSIYIEYKSESNTTPGSDCSVGCSHLIVVKRSSLGFELVSHIFI